MRTSFTIRGHHAVRLAERDRLSLGCSGNPMTAGGPVTISEAREILREDPSLVYVLVRPNGWWDGTRAVNMLGYRARDYFDPRGQYLGPDEDGVEPVWEDGE